MQIEYEVSEQDVDEALQLALRNAPIRTARFGSLLLPLLIVLIFVVFAWPVFRRGFTWNLQSVLLLAFFFMALLMSWRAQRGRGKFYQQLAAFHGRRTLTIDDAGIRGDGAGLSTEMRWETFTSFAETDNAFVLQKSQHASQLIPKRGLTPEQITELREILTRNIPAQG